MSVITVKLLQFFSCFTVIYVGYIGGVGEKFNGKFNEKITFPEGIKQGIPLDLIRQLNQISNVEEFLDNLIGPESENLSFSLTDRLGYDELEKDGVRIAKMAKCKPEPTTVSLKTDHDIQTFYYPSCTRVERCGGCCSHGILTCQPTETEILHMNVVVAHYLGGNKLKFRGMKTVHVEQHKKCKCDCIIRPENCTKYQKYNSEKCLCECFNSKEEQKCYRDKPKKIWDKDNCSCLCRDELECGSGFYFDPFNCSCVSFTSTKNQKYWNLFIPG